MTDIEVVTTGKRHDLDDEVRAAFHSTWPKFIFHDPVTVEYIERVEEISARQLQQSASSERYERLRNGLLTLHDCPWLVPRFLHRMTQQANPRLSQ